MVQVFFVRGEMDNLFWPFGIFAALTGFGLLIDKYQNIKQTRDWERIKNSIKES
jgi:hypothetical protein